MLAAVSQTRESRGARLRRRLLQRGSTRVALGLLIVMVLAALLAPWFATHDPFSGSNDALLPPLSPGYWLGTDDLGRDIWSRVVHGTRVSLLVGIASSALAVTQRHAATWSEPSRGRRQMSSTVRSPSSQR